METKMKSSLALFLQYLVSFLLVLTLTHCSASTVTYDRKSLLIDGERKILFSGSIHYPRSTPEMWSDLIQNAKNGGLDVIDTYVFWNVHEPFPGKYNFKGRYNLVRFIKLVHEAGLFLHLRIGPYVCAEWNLGGFPVWLKYVPGIEFRTNNEPFKYAMQKFVTKIVHMMQVNKLFQSQGGPIILSQIENEYGGIEHVLGNAGHEYINWAANMADSLKTEVPWVMCKEDDAPDPIINTCNGFYCDYFWPNKQHKPKMWTEAWTGWYTMFGGPVYKRPVKDLAFAVVMFIMKGGSFVNYYMYHGGTNFGRTAGGPFVTTSYDYDAPIDEYGLIRQPKYGHLKNLHEAIHSCQEALLSTGPAVHSVGLNREAYVYNSSRQCVAFLVNKLGTLSSISFLRKKHILPPRSISILAGCDTTIFNTRKVKVRASRGQMLPVGIKFELAAAYGESTPESHGNPSNNGLSDHLSVTRDTTDYLWYTTSIPTSSTEKVNLIVWSAGHAMYVFINGTFSGSAYGNELQTRCKFSKEVELKEGTNTLSVLSVTVGLLNKGARLEKFHTGLESAAVIRSSGKEKIDLTNHNWYHKVGLKGAAMNLPSPRLANSVSWIKNPPLPINKSLTWYKMYFDAPMDMEHLALDMISMGKGEVWVNGMSIGRYWLAVAGGECTKCSSTQLFQPKNCQSGCGKSTQRWYHIPKSFMKPKQNLLVVFEEIGGDPSRISLARKTVA